MILCPLYSLYKMTCHIIMLYYPVYELLNLLKIVRGKGRARERKKKRKIFKK